MMQLLEAPESAHQTLHHINGKEALDWAKGAPVDARCADAADVCPPAGDLRWVTRLHEAQICSADRNSEEPPSPEAINAPEQ